METGWAVVMSGEGTGVVKVSSLEGVSQPEELWSSLTIFCCTGTPSLTLFSNPLTSLSPWRTDQDNDGWKIEIQYYVLSTILYMYCTFYYVATGIATGTWQCLYLTHVPL